MKGLIWGIKGVAIAAGLVASFSYGVVVCAKAYGHAWTDSRGCFHWESIDEARKAV